MALGRILIQKVQDPFATFASRRPLPSATQAQTESRLLSLPVEIRVQVWAFVVGPSRTMDIDYWPNLRRIRRRFVSTREGEVPNWETALLCTSRQIYTELLPTLLGAVRMRISRPWVMMRLPELLPPQHLNMIKDAELFWELRNTLFLESDALYLSNQLKYVPEPLFRFRLCGFKHPDRDKLNAVRLKAICEVLKAMHGLEVVSLHFWVISSSDPSQWGAQEAWIVSEINKARQGREGWILTFRLFWLKEVSEQDVDGIIVRRSRLINGSD